MLDANGCSMCVSHLSISQRHTLREEIIQNYPQSIQGWWVTHAMFIFSVK